MLPRTVRAVGARAARRRLLGLSLQPKERWQLLHGMMLGLMMGHSYGDMTSEVATKLYLKMSLDDVVVAFDKFYAEPKNRQVRVESAWMVQVARNAGVAGDVVAKLIDDPRAAEAGRTTAGGARRTGDIIDLLHDTIG